MDDIIKEAFDNVEREKLAAFAQDSVLFNAVKKYLLVYKYDHGVGKAGQPLKGNVNYALNLAFNSITPAHMSGNPQLSDEVLGQHARAMAYSIQFIESGFMELSELGKKAPENKEQNNPAV